MDRSLLEAHRPLRLSQSRPAPLPHSAHQQPRTHRAARTAPLPRKRHQPLRRTHRPRHHRRRHRRRPPSASKRSSAANHGRDLQPIGEKRSSRASAFTVTASPSSDSTTQSASRSSAAVCVPSTPKHATPRRHTRAHTRRRILHHHALLRSKPKQLRPAPIRLRIRLAPLHHIAADQALRHRQPRRLQPSQQQPPRRRGHNRPALRRQRSSSAFTPGSTIRSPVSSISMSSITRSPSPPAHRYPAAASA